MKQKIFLLSMVCLSFEVMAQRETAIINPVEPIHYENKEGRFEILSYIKQDYIAKKQSSLNANMDGRALDVQFTDSPDILFNPRIKISLGWILPTFVVRTVLRVLFFQL